MKVGDNVYVKSPQRFVADCVSITGDIVKVYKKTGTVDVAAYVAKIGSGYEAAMSFPISEVGKRHGTPISKISTQPGTPGYAEWLRISRSWGHG